MSLSVFLCLQLPHQYSVHLFSFKICLFFYLLVINPCTFVKVSQNIVAYTFLLLSNVLVKDSDAIQMHKGGL